jgi:hypothetical protein
MQFEYSFHDLFDAQAWRNKDKVFKDFKTFDAIKRKNYHFKVPQTEKRRIFNRPMTLYYILASEHEGLQVYIHLVKKYKMLKQVQIDYDILKKYRQCCSCDGCFPPGIKIAIKANLIKNLTWSKFRKDWNEGEYQPIKSWWEDDDLLYFYKDNENNDDELYGKIE